ncbi:MAG: GSCFA domain-containing protein [Alistipes sp.]|nr:GSCFA domain-containing protein [Alistipes sp.]
MKFRTETEIAPLRAQIDYRSRIVALGACFAENMAGRLAAAKFRVAANPFGAMFNPESIAGAAMRATERRHVAAEELHRGANGYFHYDFHGKFTAASPDEAVARMNAAVDEAHEALAAADTVILTLGTAWVFRLRENGRTVANCHKQPAALFRREMLGADETAGILARLAEGPLAGKRIIMTVSPVRHLADGLDGNFLSKATLRVAVAEAAARCPGAEYFPAYEIVCDDLRDYRFYADDMVHPSAQAVEYVWEKFSAAALSDDARAAAARVQALTAAAAHRPLHPGSEAHKEFCRRTIAAMEAMPEVDFGQERKKLSDDLQINS